MTTTELDLETGGPVEGELDKPKRGRPKGSTNARTDNAVADRVEKTVLRLAEVLEGRGETELSAALREDAKAMAGAMASLTSTLKGLRKPLLAVLGVVEPALAFGRVVRIAFHKLSARRYRDTGEEDEGEPTE
jgi:hypothetical protein